jgi:hypothetical protein
MYNDLFLFMRIMKIEATPELIIPPPLSFPKTKGGPRIMPNYHSFHEYDYHVLGTPDFCYKNKD